MAPPCTGGRRRTWRESGKNPPDSQSREDRGESEDQVSGDHEKAGVPQPLDQPHRFAYLCRECEPDHVRPEEQCSGKGSDYCQRDIELGGELGGDRSDVACIPGTGKRKQGDGDRNSERRSRGHAQNLH